jgi:Lon protease-like protein
MQQSTRPSPQILPLFPLPMVIFPGEVIPLHIFEERFKDLMRDCMGPRLEPSENAVFGISLTEKRSIRPVGCAVRVERILKRYPDGKLDLVVLGVRRYQLIQVLDTDKTYPQISVSYFEDDEPMADPKTREQSIALHIRLVELAKGRPPQMNYPDDIPISFSLAHQAGLELPQRQTLLEMRSENARLEYLTNFYQRIIPTLSEHSEIQERIKANGYIRRFPGESI